MCLQGAAKSRGEHSPQPLSVTSTGVSRQQNSKQRAGASLRLGSAEGDRPGSGSNTSPEADGSGTTMALPLLPGNSFNRNVSGSALVSTAAQGLPKLLRPPPDLHSTPLALLSEYR